MLFQPTINWHGWSKRQYKIPREVAEELNKSYNGKILVNVGTCQLLIANNGFLKLLAVLKSLIDLDQFASDLHGFLRHSAARRVEYSESESIPLVGTNTKS